LNRFYQVAGLKPGSEFVEEAHALKVDISDALLRPFLYNDEDILSTRRKGEHIWASGGGTWLLNNRYLPVVQRPPHARVNAGKFSLFTGRADNMEELLHPALLVRELFEELVLFTGHRLYRPDCGRFSGIIDQAYTRLEADLGLDISAAQPLRLEHVLCSPKMVTVTNQGARWEGMLDCHVNSNGEINILFVLASDVDIDKLQAMDGEYHLADGEVIRHNRSIYLYDLHTAMGKDITLNSEVGETLPVPADAMTEHLQDLVESVKRKMATGGQQRRPLSKQDQLQP
jgi:hypothetical protein